MTTRGEERASNPPPAGNPPPTVVASPPVMARRTYLFLRLSVVAVIAVLAISLIKEYYRADPNCLQGSISAYYYTAVQSVFVGALVALGLVFIVLWGKTPGEDSWLNLAGLVAPVVAFVPTVRPTKCGLTDVTGDQVKTQAQTADLVDASHPAAFNNMLSYLIVVGVILVGLFAIGYYGRKAKWPSVVAQRWAFWGPLLGATALWAISTYVFWKHRDWFYDNAHNWSATTLFIFFIFAVAIIGKNKWFGSTKYGETPSKLWATFYWGLAGLMVIGAVVILVAGKGSEHRTFVLEAYEIVLLGAFWLLQTWDRRGEGAPPWTEAERQQQEARRSRPHLAM